MTGLRSALCVLVVLAGAAETKVLSGVIKLDGETPEHYISKFSIGDIGLVEGSMSSESGEDITSGGVSMFLYDAEDWPQYYKEVTCMDRARLAKYRFAIGGGGGGQDISAEQELRNSYRLSNVKGHLEFKRELKPEDGLVWYVVIADCSLEQIYHEIPPIKYDVTLLNGKHHIPAEQHGLATTYSALTVLLVLAGIGGHFLIRDQRQALGELHLIVKLLLLAYMLNLVACLFESIHLWLYGLAGTGSNVLHIMSELSNSMFGSVVNFVLLALACGWTLTDSEDGMSFMVALRDPAKMFSWTEIGGVYLPSCIGTPSSLVVMLFTFSFVAVEAVDVFTSNQDDDFAKFHAHDSTAGYALMFLKGCFCALFVYSLTMTMKVVPPRLKTFCKSMAVSGCLWFLVTPMMVATAHMFPKVQRHRYVTSGTIFIESAALLTMCRLFLTSSSEYYKLSSMANAGTMLGLRGSSGRIGGKALD